MCDVAEGQYHKFALIAICASLTLIPALINGFPFVFPDSADYLVLHPLIFRSPYYGLFVRMTLGNVFIWAPLFAQSIILVHVMWEVYARTVERPSSYGFLLIMLALVLCSSLPYFTGFIMADICTPIMFLALFLLAFHRNSLSKLLMTYLVVLATFAAAAHISNITLGSGLAVLFIVPVVFAHRPIDWKVKTVSVIVGPVVAAAASILLFNVVIFHSASLSPAGQSFLMANLIQYGPARAYLQQACPSAGYAICSYVAQLPQTADELLWTTGIYEKLGGFVGMQDEARTIVRQTLLSYPLDVAGMVLRNFGAGLLQHAPAAEFQSHFQTEALSSLIGTRYGTHALADYAGSAEMRDALPYRLLYLVDMIVVTACGLCLIAIPFVMRASSLTVFGISVVFFVLEDTLLCTAVSGVHDRYQSRVTWLCVFGVLLLMTSGARWRTLAAGHRTPGDVVAGASWPKQMSGFGLRTRKPAGRVARESADPSSRLS